MENITLSQNESPESELSRSWIAVQHHEIDGLRFGECCLKWERQLGREELYRLYKKFAIAPSVANWWKGRFLEKEGIVFSKKEKRNNRSSNTFDGVLETALNFIENGFRQALSEQPDEMNRLRLAKDWATSKLKASL
jgi:hypothetical protein